MRSKVTEFDFHRDVNFTKQYKNRSINETQDSAAVNHLYEESHSEMGGKTRRKIHYESQDTIYSPMSKKTYPIRHEKQTIDYRIRLSEQGKIKLHLHGETE